MQVRIHITAWMCLGAALGDEVAFSIHVQGYLSLPGPLLYYLDHQQETTANVQARNL